MDNNVYAPPKSNVDRPEEESDGQALYVVAKKKFFILFFATLGIYSVYWFYRNWVAHKRATGSNVWPVPRAIFSIFFVHALFRIVDGSIKKNGRRFDWNPSTLATVIVVLLIARNVVERLAFKEIGSPITDLASYALIVMLALQMGKAQEAINIACGDPAGASNSAFTAANYVWSVLGAIVWILAVIGLFIA